MFRINGFYVNVLSSYFFTKITTIIDCFELSIERPTNVKTGAITLSYDKNNNIVKYLIGTTPQVTLYFISKVWSGCTSDQHVT